MCIVGRHLEIGYYNRNNSIKDDNDCIEYNNKSKAAIY